MILNIPRKIPKPLSKQQFLQNFQDASASSLNKSAKSSTMDFLKSKNESQAINDNIKSQTLKQNKTQNKDKLNNSLPPKKQSSNPIPNNSKMHSKGKYPQRSNSFTTNTKKNIETPVNRHRPSKAYSDNPNKDFSSKDYSEAIDNISDDNKYAENKENLKNQDNSSKTTFEIPGNNEMGYTTIKKTAGDNSYSMAATLTLYPNSSTMLIKQPTKTYEELMKTFTWGIDSSSSLAKKSEDDSQFKSLNNIDPLLSTNLTGKISLDDGSNERLEKIRRKLLTLKNDMSTSHNHLNPNYLPEGIKPNEIPGTIDSKVSSYKTECTIKIQSLGRGYLARKLYKAMKNQKMKSKKEIENSKKIKDNIDIHKLGNEPDDLSFNYLNNDIDFIRQKIINEEKSINLDELDLKPLAKKSIFSNTFYPIMRDELLKSNFDGLLITNDIDEIQTKSKTSLRNSNAIDTKMRSFPIKIKYDDISYKDANKTELKNFKTYENMMKPTMTVPIKDNFSVVENFVKKNINMLNNENLLIDKYPIYEINKEKLITRQNKQIEKLENLNIGDALNNLIKPIIKKQTGNTNINNTVNFNLENTPQPKQNPKSRDSPIKTDISKFNSLNASSTIKSEISEEDNYSQNFEEDSILKKSESISESIVKESSVGRSIKESILQGSESKTIKEDIIQESIKMASEKNSFIKESIKESFDASYKKSVNKSIQEDIPISESMSMNEKTKIPNMNNNKFNVSVSKMPSIDEDLPDKTDQEIYEEENFESYNESETSKYKHKIVDKDKDKDKNGTNKYKPQQQQQQLSAFNQPSITSNINNKKPLMTKSPNLAKKPESNSSHDNLMANNEANNLIQMKKISDIGDDNYEFYNKKTQVDFFQGKDPKQTAEALYAKFKKELDTMEYTQTLTQKVTTLENAINDANTKHEIELLKVLSKKVNSQEDDQLGNQNVHRILSRQAQLERAVLGISSQLKVLVDNFMGKKKKAKGQKKRDFDDDFLREKDSSDGGDSDAKTFKMRFIPRMRTPIPIIKRDYLKKKDTVAISESKPEVKDKPILEKVPQQPANINHVSQRIQEKIPQQTISPKFAKKAEITKSIITETKPISTNLTTTKPIAPVVNTEIVLPTAENPKEKIQEVDEAPKTIFNTKPFSFSKFNKTKFPIAKSDSSNKEDESPENKPSQTGIQSILKNDKVNEDSTFDQMGKKETIKNENKLSNAEPASLTLTLPFSPILKPQTNVTTKENNPEPPLKTKPTTNNNNNNNNDIVEEIIEDIKSQKVSDRSSNQTNEYEEEIFEQLSQKDATPKISQNVTLEKVKKEEANNEDINESIEDLGEIEELENDLDKKDENKPKANEPEPKNDNTLKELEESIENDVAASEDFDIVSWQDIRFKRGESMELEEKGDKIVNGIMDILLNELSTNLFPKRDMVVLNQLKSQIEKVFSTDKTEEQKQEEDPNKLALKALPPLKGKKLINSDNSTEDDLTSSKSSKKEEAEKNKGKSADAKDNKDTVVKSKDLREELETLINLIKKNDKKQIIAMTLDNVINHPKEPLRIFEKKLLSDQVLIDGFSEVYKNIIQSEYLQSVNNFEKIVELEARLIIKFDYILIKAKDALMKIIKPKQSQPEQPPPQQQQQQQNNPNDIYSDFLGRKTINIQNLIDFCKKTKLNNEDNEALEEDIEYIEFINDDMKKRKEALADEIMETLFEEVVAELNRLKKKK